MQTQVVQSVTVADIAARARRVVGLANRRDKVQLAALATPTMVSFLVDIGGNRRWERATPSCRKSIASRPGDTVYACRAAIDVNQWEVDESWWLYFRKVDGRWLAVNKSVATSRTNYQTRKNLEARTNKIFALGWADRWNEVAPYLAPYLVQALQRDIAIMKMHGQAQPRTNSCWRTKALWVPGLGTYACGWVVHAEMDEQELLGFNQVNGAWIGNTIDTYPQTG